MLKLIFLMMSIAAIFPINGRNAFAEPLGMSQFQWKNRLLFVFAPHRDHPMFDSLHNSLAAQKSEVAERDLVVFTILESGQSSMNAKLLASETALSLRKRYNVNQGEFAVILVGKDGGIKLNRQNETRLEEIFALIDAMPMRREEIRQKSLKNANDPAVKKP
jgi:hypothetical protein